MKSNRLIRHVVKENGLTLIEVLISLAILSIGLLGLAGLQARTLEKVQSSYFKDVAADLVSDFADRVRSNRSPWMIEDSATAVTYPTAPDYAEVKAACTVSGDVWTCAGAGVNHNASTTGNSIAVSDMTEWLNSVVNQLPGGSATISATSIQNGRAWRYLVTLSWAGSRSLSSAITGDGTLTAVVE
ncbi:type IV pilus modification protein PilV [Leeia sp. TBRC 13508]|uniref:Type IV pilus modification protein PilV n=1 Tax=Leeia speluncae TaxID=2884804 RepID=A0ABS8D7E0_9NEIS|nr:type IV pilus modification protein PilV [Leeia speluncae]MCB6183558.1 type IV pilus modification protein PilV [Leeia speluncae]